MQKALGITVGFMLLFGPIAAVFAQTENANPIESAPVSIPQPVTKWDIIRSMQEGKLEPGLAYEAAFTDDELNAFFDRELSALKMKWFVDRMSVRIEDGMAEISARVLRPIRGNLTVRGAVEVANGEAFIRIESAKYGYFPVPVSFVERLGNFVMKQKSIDDWLRIGNGRWDAFELRDGEAFIKVSVPETEQ